MFVESTASFELLATLLLPDLRYSEKSMTPCWLSRSSSY